MNKHPHRLFYNKCFTNRHSNLYRQDSFYLINLSTRIDQPMEGSAFTLNGRVWMEFDNEKILGHGRVELLERIHASGSIRQAALQMKMSYKQAWDMVNHMNANFGSPVVVSQRGGKGGGKAVLTEGGMKIIEQFHVIHAKFREFLQQNSGNFNI